MRIFLTALFCIFVSLSFGQFPKTHSSAEIYHQLQKLNTGASILYLAAHPDDENTRLISYFENKYHVRTAYLSLTRGAGGQNLIGTEIGPGIGVLRTQELLGARSIDGGKQFFTRAVDFGYSKSAEETFEKWGKENILADVVFIIRKFQPDVIVTRFPASNYAGHGHHEASAILAAEAFDLAANPNAFPEQLDHVEVWQPTRLYLNTSSWWIKDLEKRASESDDYLRIDVGEYNPLLGTSYSKIAAQSRSEHKSQGFGTDYPYGKSIEYVQYVKGDKVKPGGTLLDDIQNDWSRHGASRAGAMISKALSEYDYSNPAATANTLAEAGKLLNIIKNSPFVENRKKELNDLILKSLGVFAEFTTSKMLLTPGQKVKTKVDLVNTSTIPIKLERAVYNNQSIIDGEILKDNHAFSKQIELTIPENINFSNPYWLEEISDNLYLTDDYKLLGTPENEPALYVDLHFDLNGYTFVKRVPLQEKIVDPAKAVIYNPTYVVPQVSFNFSENVVVCSFETSQKIFVTVTNHAELYSADVGLTLPDGWTSTPSFHSVNLKGAGDAVVIGFEVTAQKNAQPGEAKITLKKSSLNVNKPYKSIQIIDYDHIPAQIMVLDAKIGVTPVDLNMGHVKLIGYIDGPGDDVAKYLKAAGYKVEHLTDRELRGGDLRKYDAIITGIRAFNTREDLAFANDNLNEYVKSGGTWIVQYQTARGLKTDKIGPYPFVISAERVTDEYAEARILNPDHRVVNYPNKITDSDFDNWVQERGLYFANEWDSRFEPIISWNDPNEPPRNGGLIIAPYGEGHFVYTGISFFRELPAGVPGAYRLIANIIALNNQELKN